jgi:hypothetical protein
MVESLEDENRRLLLRVAELERQTSRATELVLQGEALRSRL